MTSPNASTPLKEIRLEAAHVEAAFALSAEAGWNQTRADWQWMLTHGEGFGLVDADGSLIASALALPFDGPRAWISMVLVTARWQRKGLATRLMQRAMAACAARGLTPLLDATPAGHEVYRALGFCDGPGFARWTRATSVTATPVTPANAAVQASPALAAPTIQLQALREEDWPALAALDQSAFGANRLPLLRALAARQPALARVAWAQGAPCGFLLARDGRSATQLGPLVASDEATACALLASALSEMNGPVYVDTFHAHQRVQDLLKQAGFNLQRPFTRMALAPGGGAFAFTPVTGYFVAAGPELG